MEKFNKATGHAILRAAKLDNLLQQLLLHALPPMSKTLAASLFDRGPLGTFSAKIDLARALGVIDVQTRRDLRVIKDVRNVFAHAENPVRFASPEVIDKARKFAQWREGASARTLFDAAADEAVTAINAKIDALLFEHATTA